MKNNSNDLAAIASRLDLAAQYVVKSARRFILNELPQRVLFLICPVNARLPFAGTDFRWLTSSEAVAELMVDGFFPEWVDLTPVRVDQNYLYILLERAELLKNIDVLLRSGSRVNPFKCKSPVLPPSWKEGDVFDLNRERTCL